MNCIEFYLFCFFFFFLFYGYMESKTNELIYGHSFCNKMQLCIHNKLSIYGHGEKNQYLPFTVCLQCSKNELCYGYEIYADEENYYNGMLNAHSIILWNLFLFSFFSKVQFHCKSMSCWHDRNEIIMTFCCYHLVYCLSF